MPAAALDAGREAKRRPLFTVALVAALLALGFGGRAEAEASNVSTRAADAPPAAHRRRSLLGIARRLREDLTKRRIIAIAAGVAFYSLLAVFPAIAALVALYGLVADPATIARHLDAVAAFVPGGAIQVIGDEINRIAAHSRGTLGVALVVGLAASLWSANGGVKALVDALNVVYGVDERRGFVALNATSLGLVVVGISFILLAIAAVVALPIVVNALGVAGRSETVVSVLRWPALLVGVALMLALVYRFGPDRPHPRWRWITWGSAVASVAWLVVSALFSWYAANFGTFNKTYGSLGAVVGFMIWLWISAIVVLIGAELDSVMERPQAAAPPHEPRPQIRGSP